MDWIKGTLAVKVPAIVAALIIMFCDSRSIAQEVKENTQVKPLQIKGEKWDEERFSPQSWIAFDPKDRVIATAGIRAGKGTVVRVWDLKTKKRVLDLGKLRFRPYSFAFSSDDRMLAVSGSAKEPVRLFETKTWKPVQQINDPTPIYAPIFFTKDSKLVGTLTVDGLTLWDTATFELKKKYRSSFENVGQVLLSPDERTIAWLSQKGEVQLVDIETSKERARWEAHDDGVMSIKFSPDGKHLATLAKNGVVARIWAVNNGDFVHTFFVGKAPLGILQAQVAFSPDSTLLAIATYTNHVPVYLMSTGEKIYDLIGHDNGFTCLAFSAKGDTVAAGSIDGWVFTWQLPKKKMK